MKHAALLVRGGLFSIAACVPLGLCGCGAGPNNQPCTISFPLNVTPTAGTADHNALPPGNQVQFRGGAAATAPPGCPVPALALAEWASWQNPDPTDITISSAADSTNGLAVCKGATSSPVALTGTFSPETVGQAPGSGTKATTATVTLECK